MVGDRAVLAEIGEFGRSVLDRDREKGFDLTSWRKVRPRRLGRRTGLFRIRGVVPATRRVPTKPCHRRARHESLYFECPGRSNAPPVRRSPRP